MLELLHSITKTKKKLLTKNGGGGGLKYNLDMKKSNKMKKKSLLI